VEENTNTETLVRRMLSDDYANKVIVTTIQKLGLALDSSRVDNNYMERLEPLRNNRIVFIFDECHRSQFGENHKASKSFSPMRSYSDLPEHPFLTKMPRISKLTEPLLRM
jgi:type I restriction enzyme R subunit